MLNAIIHGKKQGFSQDDETGLVKCVGSEDLLTASVFERLFYLSKPTLDAVLHEILIASGTDGTIGDFGCFEECEYWPSWYLNGSRVEPDCFCTFTNLDIIVEAKRWDGVQQHYFEQWERELAAYRRLQSAKGKVVLFAVGGLTEGYLKDVQTIKKEFCAKYPLAGENDFYLIAQSWAVLWKIFRQIEVVEKPHERRIINDICRAIELHGIRVGGPAWLTDLAAHIENNNYFINIKAASIFSSDMGGKDGGNNRT